MWVPRGFQCFRQQACRQFRSVHSLSTAASMVPLGHQAATNNTLKKYIRKQCQAGPKQQMYCTQPITSHTTTQRLQDKQRHTPMEQQLLWFQVLGRVLVAAGQLLQQVPQFVSAGGSFLGTAQMFLPPMRFKRFADFVTVVAGSVVWMAGLLQQDGTAAAAVEAGSAAAAATPADIMSLQQQAKGLLQELEAICFAIQETNSADVTGVEGQDVFGFEGVMQQLHAACQEGGLPQQLYKFGVACCAAFPQRSCCGNPGCTNLDKFTETGPASQGCSGCSKAVKFCSPACHKTAWKHGHKAACAVLKQRHAAAGAAAVQEGA